MCGTAHADSRDCPGQSALWVSQDPRVAEPGGLGGWEIIDAAIVSGRRIGVETKAETPAAGSGASAGTCSGNRSEPGLDFVADQLSDGKRFRALTVVEVFTRESLAIEVGQAMKGTDVVAVLNQIRFERGAPKMLFCDNGSEFTSQIMDLWSYQNGVKIDFSRPGKPTDNAYIETFNGTLRAECLDTHSVWHASRGQRKHRDLAKGI